MLYSFVLFLIGLLVTGFFLYVNPLQVRPHAFSNLLLHSSCTGPGQNQEDSSLESSKPLTKDDDSGYGSDGEQNVPLTRKRKRSLDEDHSKPNDEKRLALDSLDSSDFEKNTENNINKYGSATNNEHSEEDSPPENDNSKEDSAPNNDKSNDDKSNDGSGSGNGNSEYDNNNDDGEEGDNNEYDSSESDESNTSGLSLDDIIEELWTFFVNRYRRIPNIRNNEPFLISDLNPSEISLLPPELIRLWDLRDLVNSEANYLLGDNRHLFLWLIFSDFTVQYNDVPEDYFDSTIIQRYFEMWYRLGGSQYLSNIFWDWNYSIILSRITGPLLYIASLIRPVIFTSLFVFVELAVETLILIAIVLMFLIIENFDLDYSLLNIMCNKATIILSTIYALFIWYRRISKAYKLYMSIKAFINSKLKL